MPTFLFNETIFGPVQSRRLGCSLGINLLPNNRKLCSFNCIYCECGLNADSNVKAVLPKRSEVRSMLESKLESMLEKGLKPDVITFAGNGEPTMHPQFIDIIDDTINVRNKWCPDARIAVLSNAFHLKKTGIKEALLKVDDNILKLDSGNVDTIKAIDRPNGRFDLNEIVAELEWFKGQLIVQTMFVRGCIDDVEIDNTSDADVLPWLEILKKVNPKMVMIYTIERDTPFKTLQKISLSQLESIADKVRAIGLQVQVSG
jgi:wyosine [tRNA(Phe)-imidazoG37] synthetase (radical SAM superfamily)